MEAEALPLWGFRDMLVDVVKGRKRRVRKLGIEEAMRRVSRARVVMRRVRGEIDSLMDGERFNEEFGEGERVVYVFEDVVFGVNSDVVDLKSLG